MGAITNIVRFQNPKHPAGKGSEDAINQMGHSGWEIADYDMRLAYSVEIIGNVFAS
jgi:hypothetical protein